MWADFFNHCINAAEYIRYQPSKAGGETNSGASERIIKMHEMPVDPLEPPKFKHKKAPRGPPSPPVPVMHSPPRKVSQKDMQDWKIPPCVSNWKNAKGYTIPLDKRLAAGIAGASRVLLCLMLRAAVAAAVRLGNSCRALGSDGRRRILARLLATHAHTLTPSRATHTHPDAFARNVADGRGHSQVVISDKHAQVAESLLIAQEVSREGISARNKERERQQRIEKEKKDEQLRQVCVCVCVSRSCLQQYLQYVQ